MLPVGFERWHLYQYRGFALVACAVDSTVDDQRVILPEVHERDPDIGLGEVRGGWFVAPVPVGSGTALVHLSGGHRARIEWEDAAAENFTECSFSTTSSYAAVTGTLELHGENASDFTVGACGVLGEVDEVGRFEIRGHVADCPQLWVARRSGELVAVYTYVITPSGNMAIIEPPPAALLRPVDDGFDPNIGPLVDDLSLTAEEAEGVLTNELIDDLYGIQEQLDRLQRSPYGLADSEYGPDPSGDW